MIAPVILAVVSLIAGHPTTVACDADVNPSPFPAQPGFVAVAWTLRGGNVIHMLPSICDETNAQVGTMAFADGIDTAIHEAARARGLASESCVEMLADIGVFDMLQRFYGVPLFSPMSRQVGEQVLAITRTEPASSQPEACWASGTLT